MWGIDLVGGIVFLDDGGDFELAGLFVKNIHFSDFSVETQAGDFSRLPKMPSEKRLGEGWRGFAVLAL
ncbi:polyketide synthase [Neisseria meningitidis]|nr:polyketide synthase [Neisseria meningitidis]MBG8624191.1 polyketide synthase [Neisseria meningitidis]MBG8634991.1 polyketide synthase [Neisseria meningitidis]MBG8644096.1 polyketide synthase [Neisseria meningitidis]MBG8679879.1 polyketide synthase [Neisseria meningitidis]